MKSFAKVGLLFALIITGRYLQPAASPSVAARPAITHRALPLALARYTNPPQTGENQLTPTSSQQPTGYFL
jgi:hypothetical protein